MGRFLEWWVKGVQRCPVLVVVIACVICGFSVNYTIKNLGVNTNTTDLLSPELPFHQDRIRYWRTFPHDVKAILLAVEGATPEQTARAVDRLSELLRAEQAFVRSLYVPGEGRFFQQEALLFYELDDLETLTNDLSRAQPLISRLHQENSLSHLLALLQQALVSDHAAADPAPMLEALRMAMRALIAGEHYQFSWQQMMAEQRGQLGTTLRLVLIKPMLDYKELLPVEQTLRVVRRVADAVQQVEPGIRIRMTGEVLLGQDDMQSVRHAATAASVFSLMLVCLTLLVGLRSVTLMIVALITLIMGLALTGGFATLAIGHLNMISIAFAVLYIGLGVDYAIHLCLRYTEYLKHHGDKTKALTDSVKDVGPSITLCALTSAVAFYAFVPTSFNAVSELGIISGTSMFIGLVITLTVLPAMLKIIPVRNPRSITGGLPPWVYDLPLRYARGIRWSAIVVGIVAAASLPRITFDFNPINLRDPNSESVVLFKELLKIKDASPMTLTILADDEASALALSKKLEQLDSVEKAVTIHDFIPAQQEEKLAMVESLSVLLGPGLSTFPSPSQQEEGLQPLKDFVRTLDKSALSGQSGVNPDVLMELRAQTQQFISWIESNHAATQDALLNRLENNLLATLPYAMRNLGSALEATSVGPNDLPNDLSKRWLNPDGIYRIQVFPSKDLDQIDNLRKFITEVQAVAPNATDLPVLYMETGKEVVRAFQQAFISALIAVTVVLWVVLRNLRDTLHVLFPLMLAAVLTGAAAVWFDIPINFANIIAVPLLFGLGVDSGIHMIHTLRDRQQNFNVLHSSTARGVFFSALTTVFSFSSLAFTAHLGMASMGKLLAIGILLTLTCTLIILPAFRRSGKPRLI